LVLIIFTGCKKNPTNGKTYELGGEATFSWKELIETISNASGRKSGRSQHQL
jgi:hypothetical protein